MDKKHKLLIMDNLAELAAVTKDVDKMIDDFYEREILNIWMYNFLKRYTVVRERNMEFYEMMTCRGPQAFEILLAALRHTGNFRAEKILGGCKVNAYETGDPEMLNLAMDELDLGLRDDGTCTRIVVKRHPKNKFMDCEDRSGLGIPPYRMRSKPRGYALLINIYKTVGRDDRLGSDIDMKKLNCLFQTLYFQVIQRENLTDEQIKDEITALKKKPELINVDCLVVFVMCHGSQKTNNDSSIDLCASNGEPVNTYWIAEQFQKDTTLPEGKPRLFFFQACRVAGEKDTSTSQREVETDSELISKGKSTASDGQPPFQDTFIGYSTVPGNYSMREPSKGSWFVQIFCDVIAEHSWKHDLDDMWRLIDEEMRKKECTKGYQTTELVKRGFNKSLYFNPHLYNRI